MSKVEEVARAIFFRGGEQDDKEWKHCQKWKRDEAYEQARAAIEAMREPTPEQTLAGRKTYIVNSEQSNRIYQTMIDAAIQEGKQK